MSEHYYITTPIFYPNGRPHIGHAYNVIVSDVLARFHRLLGYKVLFTTGTDDHGLKMQRTAEKEGISPQELADKNSKVFSDMMNILNVSYDIFVRTTNHNHKKSCQHLWQTMLDNDDIYLSGYKGWYSVTQEAYFDEKETTIDEHGIRREPLGSIVEWNEEESYFFRLSKYQQPLLDFYEANPSFVSPPERMNEVITFVKSGLKDFSISRTSFEWGIPVPNDNKHVMYVWVDALTNYISNLDYPNKQSELWKFWPATTHMIGKDILRFHAIYWPAFLLSAGLAAPKNIFAHGFLLNKDKKMSKSLGNIIDPFELVKLYGLDQFRYFLLREISLGQDGNYNHEAMVNRINSDLANDLGNLAQRSLSMIAKNCNSRIPSNKNLDEEEKQLLSHAQNSYKLIVKAMQDNQPNNALSEIFNIISTTNKYFANQKPWELKKTNYQKFENILYITLELLRRIAILLIAFIPESANKLLDLLAIEPEERNFKYIDIPLKPGTILPEPKAIFPRFINEKVDNNAD
ncbi:methionine--tRNA ligase [Bartonella sp. DGB1]|uniref:methionine--tRNA ligase n=1 Tax=Bartonella sp. DGB1 TaxID=3239807 RepID=UPI003524782D